MLSCFSHVWLFEAPWTVAHQSSLSMRFSRQEYLSGLPCPSPEDLPNPRIEPISFWSPALTGEFFSTRMHWEALQWIIHSAKWIILNVYYTWIIYKWFNSWNKPENNCFWYPQTYLKITALCILVWLFLNSNKLFCLGYKAASVSEMTYLLFLCIISQINKLTFYAQTYARIDLSFWVANFS